ncbi:MAG: VOC family protein [Nannocystaceae bacterium]
MSEQNQAPSSFTWVELSTTDHAGAKHFYTELFDWSTFDAPATDHGVYTMFTRAERRVGGLFERTPEMAAQGVPPNWMGYISVADIERSTAHVRELGGKVLMGPMEIAGQGKMATIADPTGAVVALWEALGQGDSAGFGEPGFLCWSELATHDTEVAERFYTRLFGWKTTKQDMGNMIYTCFLNGEVGFAGMMALGKEFGDAPPHWQQYFAVTDCADTSRRAGELGAKVFMPPTEIPNTGIFSTLQDPQGAVFSVIQLITNDGT